MGALPQAATPPPTFLLPSWVFPSAGCGRGKAALDRLPAPTDTHTAKLVARLGWGRVGWDATQLPRVSHN